MDVPLQQEPQKVEESITAAEDTEPTSPVTTPATTHTTTIAVVETQSFYTTPKMSLDDVNSITMPAIVNILCAGRQGGTVGGATGTGIIIDSRGIILTNAHVAQYLLVSKHESEPTRCTIRTGAPARNKYIADVIAFPLVWAQEHAATIADEQQSGTGEHDWALLYITGTTDGSPLPATFPSVQFDTRQAVTTTGDAVLIASYPAGFLGGATLQKDLWPAATTVAIQKVFPFVRTTIDVLSLGGSIVAQAGASGGAVMNE